MSREGDNVLTITTTELSRFLGVTVHSKLLERRVQPYKRARNVSIWRVEDIPLIIEAVQDHLETIKYRMYVPVAPKPKRQYRKRKSLSPDWDNEL